MTHPEKMNYVYTIQQIVEPLPPEALAIMLDPTKRQKQKLIKSLIYQAAVEAFAPDKNKTIKDGWAQLDSAKFKDPANQKKFNDFVKSNLTNISARYEATVLVNDAIEQMKKKHGVDLTPERVEKLMKNLVPTLTKLGPEYMETHKLKLTRELSSSLRSGQGFISQATGTYNISNRELVKITNKMDKASQEVSNTTVKNARREREMSNPDITVKLNVFVKETDGKSFDKAPTIEDIAKIRLSNPKKFDQIFNAPKPLSPDLNAPPKSTKTRLSSCLEQKRPGQGRSLT